MTVQGYWSLEYSPATYFDIQIISSTVWIFRELDDSGKVSGSKRSYFRLIDGGRCDGRLMSGSVRAWR
jgi:hypothetical protein